MGGDNGKMATSTLTKQDVGNVTSFSSTMNASEIGMIEVPNSFWIDVNETVQVILTVDSPIDVRQIRVHAPPQIICILKSDQ